MKRHRMPAALLAMTLSLTMLPAESQSQFTFEKVRPRFAFQTENQRSFYSRTRYNRIEGLFLNLGLKVRPKGATSWTLYGDVGYGFKNEKDRRWKYNLGVEKEVISPSALTVGARYFYDLYSQDNWIINPTENTVAALFSHNDYMDYVDRRGGMLFVDYKWQQLHTFRMEIARYEYRPLSVFPNTEWSLFNRDARFPLNPHPGTLLPFLPGDETAVRLMAALDYRDNPVFPLVGWYFEGILEKTFTDFETTGLFLTVKRFQPTFGNQKLRVRLLFGSRSGSLAFQHLMSLGGIGNLRSYDHKEFIGNRLLYGTLYYNFGGDILQRLPLDFIPFWETMTLGVFWDIGYAWIADPQDPDAGLFSFGDFQLNDLKSDAGFSLVFTEGLMRLDFARRLDRSGAGWEVYFRILDKF